MVIEIGEFNHHVNFGEARENSRTSFPGYNRRAPIRPGNEGIDQVFVLSCSIWASANEWTVQHGQLSPASGILYDGDDGEIGDFGGVYGDSIIRIFRCQNCMLVSGDSSVVCVGGYVRF